MTAYFPSQFEGVETSYFIYILGFPVIWISRNSVNIDLAFPFLIMHESKFNEHVNLECRFLRTSYSAR